VAVLGTMPIMQSLGEPHGGSLVLRGLHAEQAEELDARALPWLRLTPAEQADLRALATGCYSPLYGFLNEQEHRSVTEAMRLPDGTLWPIPICLGLPDDVHLPGGLTALRDERGTFLGVIEVEQVYHRDRAAEAACVYGTADPDHPGVARVLAAPARAVSGRVQAVIRPPDGAAGRYALAPAATRALIQARRWRSTVGFQTRNPVHRAHEYLLKCALEICDGLLLHPLVGPTKDDDIPADVRIHAYEAVLRYFPAERVVLAAVVIPMRYAGPREAVLHALVRKNHGCTHFIVGRDHAGVGSYYGPFAAQELITSLPLEDLGIIPLLFDSAFYCRRCAGMATGKTCPHPPADHVALSGTQVRAALAAGQLPPPEFSRPEVASVLRSAHRPVV
jgi:sulfate adenylyltransferase